MKKRYILAKLFISFCIFISYSQVLAANLPSVPEEIITLPSKAMGLSKLSPDFFISPHKALEMLRRDSEVVIVDVRPEKEFERLRIPGSLNISLYALKTKTFLKSKKIILANEGYGLAQLEAETRRLRQIGFRIWVLEGGLSYWKIKGGLIEGEIVARLELNKIPPEIFYTDKDYNHWVFIDVLEADDREEGLDLTFEAISIPLSKGRQVCLAQWQAVLRQLEKKPLASILVFNKDGRGYERIEEIVEEAGKGNVFYLKDGLVGFNAFLYHHDLLVSPQTKIRKTKPCLSCP